MADKCPIIQKKSRKLLNRQKLRWQALALILVVWGSLYLPNLSSTPRWYGDETITLGCGQDLVKGLFTNRAVWNTYINPQFCYQPGYVFLVGLASTLSDREIGWPRLLNSLTALGIAWICLVLLGRRIGLTRAVLIALLFLTYQQSVIHFRWVYAHNLTALGFFICFSAQCLGKNSKHNWQSGGGLALAAISHPLALHGGIAAFVNRWNRPSTWIPTFLPPLIAGLLCLTPILIWNFAWWWSDLFALKDFYGGFSKEMGAGWQWPVNFFNFLSHDWLHLLGGIALIPCLFTSIRPIAVAALILVGLLTQNRQNLPVFYYQAVVALPLLVVCLGWGLVWLQRKFIRRWRWTRWSLFLLPLLMFLHVAPKVWSGNLVSRNDPWVVPSISDQKQIADWLNKNTEGADLIVCHWNIGWLLKCRNADLLQCTAWEGMKTHLFQNGLPKDRFRYEADISSAKFIVITLIDQIWTLQQPNINVLIEKKKIQHYKVVFSNSSGMILQR